MTIRPILTMEVVRRQKDLTQSELAELVGVTQPTISYIEGALIFPRPILAEAIARILEIETVDLLLSYDDFLRKGGKLHDRRRNNPFHSGVSTQSDSLLGRESRDRS